MVEPNEPEGFEDWTLATLRELGYYIDPNPKHWNSALTADYGELDGVARTFSVQASNEVLVVECKTGRWKPSDLIKLLGHQTLLQGTRSLFLTAGQPATDGGPVMRRLEECGVHTVNFPTVTPEALLASLSTELGRTHKVRTQSPECVFAWRLALAVLRALEVPRSDLVAKGLSSATASRLVNLEKLLRGKAPLTSDPVQRLRDLASAFETHGRSLCRDVCAELGLARQDGIDFHVMADGQEPSAQYAMLLELRLRLAVTAALVEVRTAGLPDPLDVPVVTRLRSGERSGLRLYTTTPQLWQSFALSWGGVLPDRSRHLALLAKECRMTTTQAEESLLLWDALFPLSGSGWMTRTSGLEILMFVPAALRGVGLRHSLTASSDLTSLANGKADLKLAARGDNRRLERLRTWWNCAVSLLDPELGAQATPRYDPGA